MAKKQKSVVDKRIKCPDCGNTYSIGAPHNMFCSARHCDKCDSNYSYVLAVYDSRANPPERRCDSCLEAGDDFYGDED